MKHKSFQEQLSALRINSQSAKPGSDTQLRNATGFPQKVSSPASSAIPAAPQATNTRTPSISQPPEDPLHQAESTIAELNSKITELQQQLDRANADRTEVNDELRNQRARVAELVDDNEAVRRQISAIEEERAQLALARRKVDEDETNALELMEQSGALQNDLEAERKSLDSDRIALEQSRAAHASELLQLRTLMRIPLCRGTSVQFQRNTHVAHAGGISGFGSL